MSLVEKCWMITSNVSVIAVLIITGICFGIFVRPYMKKKKEAIAVSTVYIAVMLVLYIVPPQIDNFSAYMMGIMAAFIVMYAEDRRNIYQKNFLLSLSFPFAGLRLQWQPDWMTLLRRFSSFKIRLQAGNGYNTDYMQEPEF